MYPGRIFFSLSLPKMLVLCDFKMTGGSESISETFTDDVSGNQQLANLNSDTEEIFMYK